MSDDFEISGGEDDDYDFVSQSPRAPSGTAYKSAPVIAAKPVKSFFALGGGGGAFDSGTSQAAQVKSSTGATKYAGDVYDFQLTETTKSNSKSSSSLRSSSSSSAYHAPSSSSSSSLAKKASTGGGSAPMSAMEKAQSMLSRYSTAGAVPAAPRQNKKAARFDEDDISIDSPRDSEGEDFEVSQSQSQSQSHSADEFAPASKPATALKPPLVSFGQKPPPPTEKPPQALRQMPTPATTRPRVESLGTVRGIHELAELGESMGSADSEGGSASQEASGSHRRPGQDEYHDVEDDDDEEDDEDEEDDDDEKEDEREADVSAYYMVDRSHFSQLEEEDEEVEEEGDERAAQGQVMSFADLAAVTGWAGEEDGAEGVEGLESSQASGRSGQSSHSHSRSEGNLVFSLAEPRVSPKAAAAAPAAAAAAAAPTAASGPGERPPPPLHYSAEPAQPGPLLQHPPHPYPYPYPQPFPADPAAPQHPQPYPYQYPPPYYSYPPPPMPFMPPPASAAPYAYQQHQPQQQYQYPYPYPYPPPYAYPAPGAPSTYASQESTLAAALREGLLLGGGLARMGLAGGALHGSQTLLPPPGAAASVDLGAGLTGTRPQSVLQERESVVFELLKELRQAKEEAAWARERIAQLSAQAPGAGQPRSPVGRPTSSSSSSTPRRRPDDEDEDNEYSADFDESTDSPSPGPAVSQHSVQFAVREAREGRKPAGQPQPQQPQHPQHPQQQPRQQSSGLSSGSMIDMQSTLLTSQTLFRKQLENLRARLEASAAAPAHPDMSSLRAALPSEQPLERSLSAPSLHDLKIQFEQRRLEQASKFQSMLIGIV